MLHSKAVLHMKMIIIFHNIKISATLHMLQHGSFVFIMDEAETETLVDNTLPSLGVQSFHWPIITRCMIQLPISKHVADDLCFLVSEMVIAHSSPDTVMQKFQTAFVPTST